MWPGHDRTQIHADLAVDSRKAEVDEVDGDDLPRARQPALSARHGAAHGRAPRRQGIQLQLSAVGGLDPDLDPGDNIRVTRAPEPPAGQVAVAGPAWSFYDFQRGTPMLILAAHVRGDRAGLRAPARGALPVGLGASLALILFFVVPAILDGKSPVAVAVVARWRWR